MMRHSIAVLIALVPVALAHAQSDVGGATQTPFDACGTVVKGASCFLFEGGGGRYYVDASEYGRFDEGDAVRVVGTLVTDCITICGDEVDGCISGAEIYDPAIVPCGTAVPALPGDLYSGLCTTATGALTGVIAGGLCCLRPGRRTRRSCPPSAR